MVKYDFKKQRWSMFLMLFCSVLSLLGSFFFGIFLGFELFLYVFVIISLVTLFLFINYTQDYVEVKYRYEERRNE